VPTAGGPWLRRVIALVPAVMDLAARAGKFDLSAPPGRLVARMLGTVARHESEHRAACPPASTAPPGQGSAYCASCAGALVRWCAGALDALAKAIHLPHPRTKTLICRSLCRSDCRSDFLFSRHIRGCVLAIEGPRNCRR